MLCPICKACFICWRCAHNGHLQDKRPGECKQLLRDRRLGKVIKEPVTSFSMAIKKLVFGEGAERIVYKVRFMNEKGRFIGPKMVAKESRFVIEANTQRSGSYEGRMEYHKEFMRTQTIASELAEKFNKELDTSTVHFGANAHKYLSQNPRIRFLKPTVVEVCMEDGTEWNVLVEEQLEGNYTKFNSNNGHVRNKDPLSLKNLNLKKEPADPGLDAIAEGSEEEEDSDDEIFDEKESGPMPGHAYTFRDEDFPQAFSHFSYEKSKKYLMVVDLQGIFRVKKDGTKEYVLTDPAIHKRRKSKKLRNWSFGPTDRGEKGMRAFFDTHECNDACRLLGLTEYKHR
jgi:hypothetical protein